jgi:hypothetical protein
MESNLVLLEQNYDRAASWLGTPYLPYLPTYRLSITSF